VPEVQPLTLKKQRLTLWDGRFFCRAKADDMRVEAAQGHLQNLRQLTEFKPLFDLPAEVRPALPIFFKGGEAVGFGTCKTEYVSSVASSALRLQALFQKADCVFI